MPDPLSKEELAEIRRHQMPAGGVFFSPDGVVARLLATIESRDADLAAASEAVSDTSGVAEALYQDQASRDQRIKEAVDLLASHSVPLNPGNYYEGWVRRVNAFLLALEEKG